MPPNLLETQLSTFKFGHSVTNKAAGTKNTEMNYATTATANYYSFQQYEGSGVAMPPPVPVVPPPSTIHPALDMPDLF